MSFLRKLFKFPLSVTAALLLTFLIIRPMPVVAQDEGIGEIAFMSLRDGNWEIYIMNADGSDERNLTNHFSNDVVPVWSPDGSQIAFRSDRDGDDDIYMMDADGSNFRRLANIRGNEGNASWSFDGSQIIVGSYDGTQSDINVINADGSNLRNLTNSPSYSEREAVASPTEDKIAFISDIEGDIWDTDIYVMDMDGGEPEPITSNDDMDSDPAWSPDGSDIAYVSQEAGPNIQLYVSGVPITSQDYNISDFAWSPDGATIAFTYDADIFVIDVVTNDVTNLTDSSAWVESSPEWSPDGSQIIFVWGGGSFGPPEIHVMDANGDNVGRLGSASDTSPTWRPMPLDDE